MGYILLRLSLNTEISSLNIVLEYQNIILEYQQVASLKHLAGLVAEERQQQLISGEVFFQGGDFCLSSSDLHFLFLFIGQFFFKITGAPSVFYCCWAFFAAIGWHASEMFNFYVGIFIRQSISESIMARQWTNLGLIKRSVSRISGKKPNSE